MESDEEFDSEIIDKSRTLSSPWYNPNLLDFTDVCNPIIPELFENSNVEVIENGSKKTSEGENDTEKDAKDYFETELRTIDRDLSEFDKYYKIIDILNFLLESEEKEVIELTPDLTYSKSEEVTNRVI